MPHRDIKVGDPVIINDCDEPSAKMIVVVTESTAERVAGYYLNARKRKEYPGLCWSRARRIDSPLQGRTAATHIADFGYTLAVAKGTYRVFETGDPCVAIYPDGVPRKWQGRGPEVWLGADKRSLARLKL